MSDSASVLPAAMQLHGAAMEARLLDVAWDMSPEDIFYSAESYPLWIYLAAMQCCRIRSKDMPPGTTDAHAWVRSQIEKKGRPWDKLSRRQRLSYWRRALLKAKPKAD